MPVALFGCENWSLTLKKEHRLREYESMVLRRVCGAKREDVKGECLNIIVGSLMFCTAH